jgi:hypothetical protein
MGVVELVLQNAGKAGLAVVALVSPAYDIGFAILVY